MEKRINIKEILNKHKREKKELISLLQSIQDKFGYLPEEAIRQLSRFLNVSENEIYGVATFYAQFRFQEPPKHLIKVCLGTACHVRGAPRVLEELERELEIKRGEVTKDGMLGLEIVNCVGACALGPIVIVDEQYYGQMTSQKARDLVDELRKGEG